MVNLQKIRRLIEQKKLRLSEFCEAVGITTQGLRDMEKRNSTNLNTLDRIAKFLGVPISYFFEENDENVKEEKAVAAESENPLKMVSNCIDALIEQNEKLLAEVQNLYREVRLLEHDKGILEGRLYNMKLK